jgi:CelD/BcsL family acetyltransferase involved in cellulose biosynthesis
MSELALTGIAQRGVAPTAAKRAAYRHALAAEALFGADAYEALRADWLRLAQLQGGTVLFQTPELLSAWARHFARRRRSELATIVVRHEDRAVLIWPLLLRRRGFVRIAAGAGAPIGQYDEILLDPDYDGDAVLAAALATLADTARPDLISLERVRADSALRAALNGTPPLSWAEGAPYTDLSGGMEGVWSTRKPRVVRQQKKRVRHFRQKGAVDFAVAADAAQAEAWLAEALALKREWLRATGRVSRAFMRPETGACLAELARALPTAEDAPRMVVSRLALNGRTAAIEAGFRHRGVYHLYLGAFEPELAKLGPGNVLTQHVLEWCVANGVQRYDMLAPRSRNKREWQTNEVAIVDFALPLTLRGRLYAALALKRLAPAMRDLFYALPPRVRSCVAAIALKL